MKNRKIKLIFDDNTDIDYRLHDSELAQKWATKIERLQFTPIDPIESKQEDISDLEKIYAEFCDFANIDPIEVDVLDQQKLNQLHQVYEEQHDRLAGMQNNQILYRFHHAVHFREELQPDTDKLRVSWGRHEGRFTEQFNCYDFYDPAITKNNIYLPWSELGKTPVTYWKNGEPNDQHRFNTLAKIHTTFRAQFIVALKDKQPSPLEEEFIEWFDKYKEGWFAHHGIKEWNSVLEYSAPLLATTDFKGSLDGMNIKKILIW